MPLVFPFRHRLLPACSAAVWLAPLSVSVTFAASPATARVSGENHARVTAEYLQFRHAARTPAVVSSSEPGLWENHRVEFIAGIVVTLTQAGLIIWLLIHRRARKQSEAALLLSIERYREVVESQNEMVCRYHADTTLTFVNQAYCRFFGRKRELLLGRKFTELIPAASHGQVHRLIAGLTRERRAAMHEHEVLRPDGTIGWHQWEDFAVVDGNGAIAEYQGVGRDITERKLVEEALRESEARISLAADAAGLGFWVWDVKKDELWMTEKRREQLGMKSSERVTYAAFVDRVHPEDRELVRERVESAIGGDDLFESEYRVTNADGEVRWVASRGRCTRNAEGAVTQLMGVSIDITTRKRTEETMRSLTHTDRLTIVGELTGSIAHEINQPLCAILSNAEAAEMLLEKDVPPLEELRQILSDIRRDNQRASDVIRQVRTLLRKRELRMEPLDVQDVVGDVVRMIAPDARRRGVTIEQLPGAPLPLIHGDRIYLQQVLLNLLLNGMDAMAAVAPPSRCLTLRTTLTDRTIELSVTDCGHGIPVDRLPRIFDSFYSTKEDGMGLGLAIARSVAELHGGRISAENNQDGGATFRVMLPTVGGEPAGPTQPARIPAVT